MRAFLKRILIICCLTSVILVGLEGLGRLAVIYIESKQATGTFGDHIMSHNEPLLGFGLQKNLDILLGHWKVVTNRLGFRDEEVSETKPSNEIRLFIMGGSTVFGWAAQEKDTIPTMIERLSSEYLHKKNSEKTLRIINAGVPWYASWHETASVIFRVLPLKPDWIIILDGLNDAAQAINPNWAPMHRGFQDLPTTLATQKRKRDGNFAARLLQQSQALSYFLAKYQARQQTRSGVYRPEVWDQYDNYMRWLNGLLASQNVRFSVFLQPVMAVDRDILEIERITDASALKIPEFADTFRRTYEAGIKKLTAGTEYRFETLHALFKNEKDRMYYDGLHYTGQGNWVIATAIFDKEVRPHLDEIIQSDKKHTAYLN